MPRPPAVPSDAIVDANVQAYAGARLERSFSGAELPRLQEAGARNDAPVNASFHFSLLDSRPAIDGTLAAEVMVTCQRCMLPVKLDLQERFRVVLVDEEREDEPVGYEPILADASRLDLRWLVEEQVLLALPFAPMHEQTNCLNTDADSQPEAGDRDQNRPFQNLRDMLRER